MKPFKEALVQDISDEHPAMPNFGEGYSTILYRIQRDDQPERYSLTVHYRGMYVTSFHGADPAEVLEKANERVNIQDN